MSKPSHSRSRGHDTTVKLSHSRSRGHEHNSNTRSWSLHTKAIVRNYENTNIYKIDTNIKNVKSYYSKLLSKEARGPPSLVRL